VLRVPLCRNNVSGCHKSSNERHLTRVGSRVLGPHVLTQIAQRKIFYDATEQGTPGVKRLENRLRPAVRWGGRAFSLFAVKLDFGRRPHVAAGYHQGDRCRRNTAEYVSFQVQWALPRLIAASGDLDRLGLMNAYHSLFDRQVCRLVLRGGSIINLSGSCWSQDGRPTRTLLTATGSPPRRSPQSAARRDRARSAPSPRPARPGRSRTR
jgi:hypothetical protein